MESPLASHSMGSSQNDVRVMNPPADWILTDLLVVGPKVAFLGDRSITSPETCASLLCPRDLGQE